MSIQSPRVGEDNSAIPATGASALTESLALLTALGWKQALFRIEEVKNILGTSRASIYRDIAADRLEAVKIGAATRITARSLARRLAELPRAPVRSSC